MTKDVGVADRVVEPIASGRDELGRPEHRGWLTCGGRRRWMAPFILVLLAEEPSHGYGLIGRLREMGVAGDTMDVGQVYRTLRCLERLGHVRSWWSADPTGPRRREYELTDDGRAALDEWAVVMAERQRLIDEFEVRYGVAGRMGGAR